MKIAQTGCSAHAVSGELKFFLRVYQLRIKHLAISLRCPMLVAFLLATLMLWGKVSLSKLAYNFERTYLVSPAMMGITGIVLSVGIPVSLKFMLESREADVFTDYFRQVKWTA
jgi:hypothetical protein